MRSITSTASSAASADQPAACTRSFTASRPQSSAGRRVMLATTLVSSTASLHIAPSTGSFGISRSAKRTASTAISAGASSWRRRAPSRSARSRPAWSSVASTSAC
jgi:hypothetical protein